ncbi:MAG: hydroxyethylthiazole kinase, partial [Frankiaceae bacterium]|jgi:hydroxyethylthiazole kinase|nr:hydroxyethylthiazole kinase [Frankiaceae bacterium]
VHCVTNIVVANFTANVLLAAGAAPAMVNAPEESGVLAGAAGALLINLGTITADQREGMSAAVDAALGTATPWVLDPVAIGALPMRTAAAAQLAARRPAIIRGNASEIAALAGGAGGRGVDSTVAPDEVSAQAREVAAAFGTVAAVSGARDLLTDGTRTVRVASGNPALAKVTGVGCALGALMAACAAVTADPLLAAAAATALVCVAGDTAARAATVTAAGAATVTAAGAAAVTAAGAAADPAERSVRLGTFAVALMDALATLSPAAIAARARLA